MKIVQDFGLNKFINETKDLVSDPANAFSGTYANVINLLVVFAGVLAVIFALNAGSDILTAFGGEEKVAGAKKTLIYVAIGLAVVILAIPVLLLLQKLITTGTL